MSKSLALAAALMTLTTVLHIFGGGAQVYDPMAAVMPSPELGLYLALLWHFITAYLALAAAGLWYLVARPGRQPGLLFAIAVLSLAMGLLFLAFGISYVGTIWYAPQWTVLIAMPLLILASLRTNP